MPDANEKVIYPVQMPRRYYEQIKKFAAAADLTGAQIVRRALRRELKILEQEAADQSPSTREAKS